jgi:transcriptional regulator with XRE-family HTH domain
MDKLPALLRQARRARNLNQQEVADYLGFAHRSQVSKIEKGQLELSAKNLLKLANLLNLDLNSLKGAYMKSLNYVPTNEEIEAELETLIIAIGDETIEHPDTQYSD